MSQVPPYQGQYAELAPHRGVLVLVFGIIGLTVCGPLGVAAWIMGRSDLKSIDAGVMDPTGRGLTMAGMVCGIIASILLIISLCFVVLWFLFIIVAVGSGGMGP
jgi:hypothetical protein